MPTSKQEPLFPPIGDQSRIKKSFNKLTAGDIAALDWYYRMELKPGCFTGGFNVFTNMIPTASMLRRVNVDGLRALDIGGMECAFSVLLDRAGANVGVYDRLDMTDRIKLVKEAYESDFDYWAGQPFHDFAADRVKSKKEGFDFVLFSGVLYHVIEPTLFLYYMRSLMKPGALLVLETSLVPDDECCLYFNEAGRFYKGSNYYQVSSTWLDYTLRLLGFKIHNMDYVDNKPWKGDGRDIVRCALIAELTDKPVVGPRDRWAPRKQFDRELEEFISIPDYPSVDLSDRITPEGFKKYGVARRDLLHKGTQSVDLTKLLRTKPPLPINEEACVRFLKDTL